MRWTVLCAVVLACVAATTTTATSAGGKRFAYVDANFHASESVIGDHVTYVDADSDESDSFDSESESVSDLDSEDETAADSSFVQVGESDDNGIYYDAANMPSWLVPPWVSQNSPTGPLIPTYGSGYLSKTFNIQKWQGAVPPQPVFPLDTGYAASAVDSDHFPQSGVFPNDARYHSPALTVTAPIFLELSDAEYADAHDEAFDAATQANVQMQSPPVRRADQRRYPSDDE